MTEQNLTLSIREVMIAYYEAHPNEVPSEAAPVSKKGSVKEKTVLEPKVKRGFSSRDYALALGTSFGVTFLVVVVLYLLGGLN